MSFPAGWYDDPQDPTQQRYWDGGFWTDYRRPREGPPPYQGQFGQPGSGQQQGFGPGLGQPGMGRVGYGPQSQQGQHGQQAQQGFGYGPRGPVTPDGQPLAGWWKRVFARVIDALIVFFVSLPLTGYFYYQYFVIALEHQQELLDRGESPFSMTPPAEAYQWIIPASLIGLLVAFVYDYLFLTRSGATIGKKAVGISVRLRDVPGPPPQLAVLKRCGFFHGLGLLGAVPLIGTLLGLVSLLNVLWPLWDEKKQALHDKFAATNVVVGPQPPRSKS
ncbi:hypothetical protein GCM10009789_55840 [Kribbella sancticallisti]|uniref:RDD family protein n=1 Tax=Kribbella sancticallisti TaxID=460087 RepID=A0ABN2E5D3_9ACTN